MKNNILLVLFVCMSVVLVSGCTQSHDSNTQTNETIVLSDDMILDDAVCAARGIRNEVVAFYSPGCPACAVAIPRLKEIEKELNMTFEYVDVSSGQERILELGLVPAKIPTVIIDCRVYVGTRTKEEYRNLIAGG